MLAVAALAASLAGSSAHECAAAIALFQAVRAHTGGARWDRVAELRADGRTFGSGLPGTTAMALDLRTGRSAVTDESAVVREKVVRLTDVMWEQDLTGGVHPMDAPDARAAARTTAYLVRNGFFRPATDPARFTCLPDAHEDGTLLRRVEVVPRGGRAVTLWIDPSAHVIVRAQQQAPTHVETISYGAYRAAGGLLLPHEIIEADDRPEDTVVRTVRRYRVASAVDARDFARPPEPANERWRDGATSTQLDIDVDAGAPVVDAYVDGKGPFAFILDTGGHAILTAEAAKNLGLTVVGAGVSGGAGEGTIQQGFARVRSVRIGDAEITDFPMFVIPYPKEFSDRGSAKPPLAGILGLEVFERFAVTIDYVHRTLRLQSPHRFRPPPGDRGVRIVFQEDEPLAWARADGVTGLFGLDTGNGGRAFLFGDFLRRNGFFRRYAAGATSRSLGTGGAVFASTYRLEELTFGGLTMHEFPTNFVVQRKGSFSSRTEAGNLGHDVLAQFALTTDYAHGVMYVHPEPGAPLPAYPGTGLSALSRDAQGHFVVQAVIARSPAADAGIAKGDVVLAIDGTPTDRMAPADLAALARRPAGTALRFTVRSGTAQREVTLTTRNLLCNAGAARCEPWVETAR